MPKVKFILERGGIGSDSSAIVLDGLVIPEKEIPILQNFDITKPLGRCKPSKHADRVELEYDLSEELLDLYPAIGCQQIEARLVDGIRYITHAKLLSVSLCTSPNADPSIKTIRQQLSHD
jgi:hypothetical protein